MPDDNQPATGPTDTQPGDSNSNQSPPNGDQQNNSGQSAPDTGDADWSAITQQWQSEGLTPGQVAERLKASRKWEQRAKDNSQAKKDLDALKQQSMTDQELAVEQARTDAAAQVRTEMGRELAEAKFRALSTGRISDVDAALEFVDLNRFIDESGRPDTEAINGAIERMAKLAPAPAGGAQPPADLKQGSRGASGAPAADPNAWLRRAAHRS